MQSHKNKVLYVNYYVISEFIIVVKGFIKGVTSYQLYKYLLDVIMKIIHYHRVILKLKSLNKNKITIEIKDLHNSYGDYNMVTDIISLQSTINNEAISPTLFHEIVHQLTVKIIVALNSIWGIYLIEGLSVFGQRLYYPQNKYKLSDWDLFIERLNGYSGNYEGPIYSVGYILVLTYLEEISNTLNRKCNSPFLDKIISNFYDKEFKIFKDFFESSLDLIIFDKKSLYRWGLIYNSSYMDSPIIILLNDSIFNKCNNVPFFYVEIIDPLFYKYKTGDNISGIHWAFVANLQVVLIKAFNKSKKIKPLPIENRINLNKNIKLFYNNFFEQYYNKVLSLKNISLNSQFKEQYINEDLKYCRHVSFNEETTVQSSDKVAIVHYLSIYKFIFRITSKNELIDLNSQFDLTNIIVDREHISFKIRKNKKGKCDEYVFLINGRELKNESLRNYMTRNFISLILKYSSKDYLSLISTLNDHYEIEDIKAVLTKLLKENVSIGKLITIFKTLCEYNSYIIDHEFLVEKIRQELSYQICQPHLDSENTINIYTLCPILEQEIINTIIKIKNRRFSILPIDKQKKLVKSISNVLLIMNNEVHSPVLLTSESARPIISQIFEQHSQDINVLSVLEVQLDNINFLYHGYIDSNFTLQECGE